MTILHKRYPQGQFAPERGLEHNWHVWCEAGVKQVLDMGEYPVWLSAHPDEPYSINFANGGYARIDPEDSLWEVLAGIARHFRIEVFTLPLRGGWVAWGGSPESLREFDCIRIWER